MTCHPARFCFGVLLAFATTASAHASCGSAFCSINTNWSTQGVWTEPGLRMDLRYEYINQDQPRAGIHDVKVGEVPGDHDEVRTINHNWLAGVDYSFASHWGVSAAVPIVDRSHEHIHNDGGTPTLEQWQFTKLGDARVLGRYQTNAGNNAMGGVEFGLKLPSGRFDVANDEGEVAERSLQPGSGTTDALLGAYYHHALPGALSSWFARALWQIPLYERAGFRPGYRLSFDAGARYDVSRRLGASLQINAQARGHDRGTEAEPEDSGKAFIGLSPGIAFAVARDLQFYGYVQVPLYENVNGVQLTANYAVAAGISKRL